MDKKEVTEVILLDLSSAFDTIDHGLMLDFLECDFSVIGPVRDWIAPYLLNRRQHIVIWKVYLTPSVPQGSCLNSVLFLLYASSLFRIVSKHLPDTHGYADDSLLYLSFKPDSRPNLQQVGVRRIQDYIAEVRAWMIPNNWR